MRCSFTPCQFIFKIWCGCGFVPVELWYRKWGNLKHCKAWDLYIRERFHLFISVSIYRIMYICVYNIQISIFNSWSEVSMLLSNESGREWAGRQREGPGKGHCNEIIWTSLATPSGHSEWLWGMRCGIKSSQVPGMAREVCSGSIVVPSGSSLQKRTPDGSWASWKAGAGMVSSCS